MKKLIAYLTSWIAYSTIAANARGYATISTVCGDMIVVTMVWLVGKFVKVALIERESLTDTYTEWGNGYEQK